MLAAYPATSSYGISRDCSIGGRSEHKEGRTWDWAVSVANPDEHTAAHQVFDWLFRADANGHGFAMARRLGVMYIIHNRHIWGSYRAAEGWRPYVGANPHTDHTHFSFRGGRAQADQLLGRIPGALRQRRLTTTIRAASDTLGGVTHLSQQHNRSAERQPFVRLEGVSKSYGVGPNRHHVLDRVDLDLRSGETTSLIGRSGSGKSTLIALIAGLMRPDAGHIHIGGLQTDTLDEAGRTGLRAERIGVVLQSDNLIPFLTAVENVELAMGFGSRRGRLCRARELLAELGLADRMDHLPRQLSGGEAQRVAVAVALVNEPDLLLADEVVGQLDSSTAAHVTEVVFAASRDRGLAVLYVTHDEQLARQAQHALRLGDRRILPA